MTLFDYKGITSEENKYAEGSIEAINEDEVANALRTQGLFITAIDPEPLLQTDNEVKDDILTAMAQKRVKQDDVIVVVVEIDEVMKQKKKMISSNQF